MAHIQCHFVATGVVFNSKNEVLMIKHRELDTWLPPGGHIEENEIPDVAVLREIFEETGITAELIVCEQGITNATEKCNELAKPIAVLLEDIDKAGEHKHIDLLYICRSLNESISPNLNEVDDAGWFEFHQLSDINTPINVINTIRLAISQLHDI